MKNSRFLRYMTECHDPLCGVSWFHVLEQEYGETDKDLGLNPVTQVTTHVCQYHAEDWSNG